MANRILSSLWYFVLLLLLQKDFIKADSSDCGTSSAIGKTSGLIKSHKGFGTTLYPKKLNCTWNIHPPTAYKVKVEFLVFDLENSTRCYGDNLMITYGRTRHIFCGSAVPSAITTSSNVQLTFNTDENTESLGFLIRYIYFRQPSPLQECGVITDMGGSGVLTSPNYPLNYTNDLSCRWKMKASHGKWLTLGLDLELEGTVAEGCQYDYLSLHDMVTDQPIRRYCGVIHSQSIKTNTNHIRIDFITDSQNTQSGFVMTWQSEHSSADRNATTVSKGSLSSTASQETKTQSTPSHLTVGSSIKSNVHQYPSIIHSMPSLSSSSVIPNTQQYPKTTQSAIPGSSVTPNIHQHQKTSRSTAIPSSTSPAPSTLRHQMKTLQALTSSRISPVSTTTKTLFPHSTSTPYQTLPSGQLNGNTVNTPACGSILFPNTSAGSIELPHQPNGEYFPSLDCQWLLVGEPGSNIIVNFESFDVETSTNCAKDYLAFYDGASEVSRMVAKYCGKDLPASVIATGNKMFIKFHSDQSVQGKGIMLQYLQMVPVTVPTLPVYQCPKNVVEIRSESGLLMSIGFTGYTNYSPNLNCQWQITTTPGKVLRLRFSDFETEYAESCQYDHLEIWDRVSRNRTMLGKYCGIRLPRDITTTSNTVYIKFVSDGAVSGIGFNLTYHTMENIASCTRSQYKCIDGGCIDRSAVCDNKTDCPDKTDELFCDVNKTCGRPSIKATLQERRIVGGEEAVRGSWPWQASVSHKGTFMCGGSLLNPYWIVTAAHCFGVSIIPREWQVGVGKHYLMQAEKGVETIGLADIIIHPQYNSHTSYNDIALLRLKHPVNMTSRISTICLPLHPQHIAQNCYVTGWGDSYDTCCPDVLKQAMVPVLNTTLCNNTNHYNGRVLDSMFCAGYTSRQIDACHGDSGGPLVSLYSDGKWYLQGIISWGIGCADSKHPGIYTGVYQFNSWIQSVIYQM